MPTTDPYTPEQVRRWRESIRRRIDGRLSDANDKLFSPEFRARCQGLATGYGLSLEVLDDLFGPED